MIGIKSEGKKKALAVCMTMTLLFGLVQTQRKLATYQATVGESLLYLPSGKYLKPLALGYDQLFADLLWMKTISYFGGHFMSDRQYPWLAHMLNLIIDLDPRFDFPYYFGGVVLSLEASQIEQANRILERGMEVYPDRWQYPFYIGFNYYYHQKDVARAFPYLQKAASFSEAPDFLKRMVARLNEEAGNRVEALHFYEEVYRNTDDEMLRQKVKEKIDQIKLSDKE
jgi:tetratricopeptide (TPR) repeat protein